jgi:hypothetical protein
LVIQESVTAGSNANICGYLQLEESLTLEAGLLFKPFLLMVKNKTDEKKRQIRGS